MLFLEPASGTVSWVIQQGRPDRPMGQLASEVGGWEDREIEGVCWEPKGGIGTKLGSGWTEVWMPLPQSDTEANPFVFAYILYSLIRAWTSWCHWNLLTGVKHWRMGFEFSPISAFKHPSELQLATFTPWIWNRGSFVGRMPLQWAASRYHDAVLQHRSVALERRLPLIWLKVPLQRQEVYNTQGQRWA